MLNETTAKQLRDIIQEEIKLVLEELSTQKLDTDKDGVTTHTIKSNSKNAGYAKTKGNVTVGRIRPTAPLKKDAVTEDVDEGVIDKIKSALTKQKKDPGEEASANRIKASMKAAKEPKQTPLTIWNADAFYPKMAKKKVTEEATPDKAPEKKPRKKKDKRSEEDKAREIGQTEMFEGKRTLSEWKTVLKELADEKKTTINIPVDALPLYKKGQQKTVINPKTGDEEIESDVSSWAKK